MNSILTNDISTNSFLGLVINSQKNNSNKLSARKTFGRKAFVKVESKEVLMNMALATVIIVMGLTMGSVFQNKMEFSQYASLTQKADV
ncbi:MAG: hypothetical protein COA93_05080 [Alphaproteobacteria bacterium]|nr:MAG: hypothetical protein COA93_05080 [Alphaproteobacteria bacterium]